MSRKLYPTLTILTLFLASFGSFVAFMKPVATTAEKAPVPFLLHANYKEGRYVVVHLNTMVVELKDGETVLAKLPILSQGKPGSYYETIGGEYASDYKSPLHFSSIGHVYMPWSVHVFGNYFIHGIPYYPNGEQVSSGYSGGCIRLNDMDARALYNFMEDGMPIIVTRGAEDSFKPTELASTTLASSELTNLMVAAISLEALTQDTQIVGVEEDMTTRRNMLPYLLRDRNTLISRTYAKSVGEKAYIDMMNEKARSLGLSNTYFDSIESPVATTYEDYDRFMKYIDTYKSYLRGIEKATSGAL